MFQMILILVFSLVSLAMGDVCSSIPPSLWCGSQTIEKECGFTAHCMRFRTSTRNQPIQLTLLMEGLCPGCQAFLTETLYPNVFKNFGEFVNIEIVPYGNAKIVDGVIKCQHGEEECQINKFESCLIDSVESQDKYVPIIYCIENQLKAQVPFADATDKCFRTLEVGGDVQRMIQSCLVSRLGARLQEKAAARTDNVWPEKHTHVPWMLFNNVSLGAAQGLMDDLPNMICQWYTGDKPIPYCRTEAKKLYWKTTLKN